MNSVAIEPTWLDTIIAKSKEESNESYHDSDGTSNSMLSVYLDDPREFHYQFLSGRYRKVSKDCFDFGTAVHDISLLGEDNVVVIPPEALTKDSKRFGKAWDAFKEQNEGRLLLKADDYANVMRCVNAVREHPIAGPLLRSPGVSERSFAAHFDYLEMLLRCRPDRIVRWRGRTIVIDLKTTTSSVAAKFVKAIANFGYANQEYFYRKVLAAKGIEVDAFVFVAVKDEEPHCVDCYTIAPKWLDIAKDDVEGGLESLAKRKASNDWTSITNSQIVELSPPNFVNYKNEYSL